jgi:hypothetical protein
VTGVLAGAVLIVAGLAPPGLLQRLAQEIQAFRDSLSSPFPGRPYRYATVEQPRWLACLGVAVIAATLVAYLAG